MTTSRMIRLCDPSRPLFRGRFILSIVSLVLFTGCGRSILPSDRTMMSLTETELRDLVLTHTPIGTHRPDVEQTFRRTFRRKWEVIDYEHPELMSQRGFKVAVFDGDYFFSSNLVTKSRGIFLTDVVTVYYLFGPTHRLKDVAVERWTDSI